jgi:hypothetical protein
MMNLRSTLGRGAAAFALCGLLGAAQAAVVGEEVEYDVDGVKLTGYLAYDDAIQG